MARLRGLLRENRGQGLVEMAIVLPVLLLLLFGMIEFGRIFNAFLVTKEASREGARLAIVGKNNSAITTAVKGVGGMWNPAEATITINPEDLADRKKGDPVTVTVHYNVALIAPVISGILPNPFPVTGSTVMRIE